MKLHDTKTAAGGPAEGRGNAPSGLERFSVLVVSVLAIAAAIVRSLKPTNSGWFNPAAIDEKVFMLLMVPLLWYLFRVAQSFKLSTSGLEWTRLTAQVGQLNAQQAVTQSILTMGVGGKPASERESTHLRRDFSPSYGATRLYAEGALEVADAHTPLSQDAMLAHARNIAKAMSMAPGVRTVPDESANADPQKGRWGGEAVRNGRQLRATVVPATNITAFFTVHLEVTASAGAPKLDGVVRFHLHPSFQVASPVVPVRDGIASLTLVAWGAFTVGAEADGGKTALELDLAKLPDAPFEFTSR